MLIQIGQDTCWWPPFSAPPLLYRLYHQPMPNTAMAQTQRLLDCVTTRTCRSFPEIWHIVNSIRVERCHKKFTSRLFAWSRSSPFIYKRLDAHLFNRFRSFQGGGSYTSEFISDHNWSFRWGLPQHIDKCQLLTANIDQLSVGPLHCMSEVKGVGFVFTHDFHRSWQCQPTSPEEHSIDFARRCRATKRRFFSPCTSRYYIFSFTAVHNLGPQTVARA